MSRLFLVALLLGLACLVMSQPNAQPQSTAPITLSFQYSHPSHSSDLPPSSVPAPHTMQTAPINSPATPSHLRPAQFEASNTNSISSTLFRDAEHSMRVNVTTEVIPISDGGQHVRRVVTNVTEFNTTREEKEKEDEKGGDREKEREKGRDGDREVRRRSAGHHVTNSTISNRTEVIVHNSTVIKDDSSSTFPDDRGTNVTHRNRTIGGSNRSQRSTSSFSITPPPLPYSRRAH